MADLPAIGCVDPVTGRVLWTTLLDSVSQTGETALDDHAWYVGTDSRRVHAFNPLTGALLWSTTVAPNLGFLFRVWGITVSGDTAYVTTVRWLTEQGGSVAGDLVALDRSTGRVLMTYVSPGSKGGFQGRPVIASRLAIMNDVYAHVLVAVDRFTGAEQWRTGVGERGYLTSERAPVVLGDTVFAASTDTQVYALDVATGTTIWQVFGNRGSLGDLALCGSQLVAADFGGSQLIAVDRARKTSSDIMGLLGGDLVMSRLAANNEVLVLTGRAGVYGLACK
ncbi:MAG: PQQ-binding-like beta-propeller repeat protein [Gemmatimonadota bacterium]|nr:PQQ-binding-like beta-propeller repeat protein [Gemmatimonadota bacterium]